MPFTFQRGNKRAEEVRSIGWQGLRDGDNAVAGHS